MLVCDEWVLDTKPGGTAGVYALVPAERIVGDEGIFLCMKAVGWENEAEHAVKNIGKSSSCT